MSSENPIHSPSDTCSNVLARVAGAELSPSTSPHTKAVTAMQRKLNPLLQNQRQRMLVMFWLALVSAAAVALRVLVLWRCSLLSTRNACMTDVTMVMASMAADVMALIQLGSVVIYALLVSRYAAVVERNPAPAGTTPAQEAINNVVIEESPNV